MLSVKTISIQRIEILGLLLVIFFAVALRFYELDRGYSGLGIYSATSLNTGTSLHNWFFPSIFIDGSIIADKPPLFFWIQGLFLKILGPTNMALRLPAALCGTSCVVLLYLILRRTYGVLTAFAGGLFLAIAPIDVNFSRGVFLEPLTTALILLSIFMLLIGVERKQVKFIYIASAVIGIAFMSKLWQGLLPVPALAVFVIILRWEAWGRFLKTATVAFVIFIITALVWPTLVWLFDSQYDAVMHSENIWDMIFGWNLFDRFGGLQYGSTHDPSWFWFLTGPMQLFLGITFIPLAVLGGLKTVYDLPTKIFSKTTSKEKLVPCIGLIWLMWLLICIVGFGGGRTPTSDMKTKTSWSVGGRWADQRSGESCIIADRASRMGTTGHESSSATPILTPITPTRVFEVLYSKYFFEVCLLRKTPKVQTSNFEVIYFEKKGMLKRAWNFYCDFESKNHVF